MAAASGRNMESGRAAVEVNSMRAVAITHRT